MVESFRENYIEKELDRICAEEAFGEPKIETVPIPESTLPAVISNGSTEIKVANRVSDNGLKIHSF